MTSRVTCADRRQYGDGAYCKATIDKRCIDVPPDRCRMTPIDAETGKELKRKFTVKKENVKEKWW